MNFVVITDADMSIGTGHLMRCLALAQEIKQKRHEASFITYCDNEKLCQKIRTEGFRIHVLRKLGNLKEAMEILNTEKPDWVILDGYHFGTDYQKWVKDSGYRLLVVDDYAHIGHYYSDIILNQNYAAEKLSYRTEKCTELLLGTQYVLLRKEFFSGAGWKREFPEIGRNIAITMGGGDAENNTLAIVKALNHIKQPLHIKIVMGASNPHYDSIRNEAGKGAHTAEILTSVNNMASIISWADLGISAGGITTWELAFLGLPSLLCIVAENQEKTVKALAEDGFFLSPGWFRGTTVHEIKEMIEKLILDKNLRKILSEKSQTLVDGKGAERVFNALMKMPIRILFLGGHMSRQLANWLESQGETVLYTEEKIDQEAAEKFNPDLVISYNYRYIVKGDLLSIPKRGAINLHISYLPWNRGAHPNVWSFIDNTPKGVTIHYMDEGIDTGDIIFQREVSIDETKETLKSSYDILHTEIQNLFKTHWLAIKSGELGPKAQIHSGTIHYRKDGVLFQNLIAERGWDIPINEFKEEIISVKQHGS
jgi:UDP-2,4-diacetamido-2,4,6-trideoxy-beta-L-altropyranose hydrolase